MNTYKQFVFESYHFDREQKKLDLNYSFDGEVHFTETYTFNFELADYDPAVLDRAIQLLYLMAGVSYYKKFIPPEIVIKNTELDLFTAKFFGKTYQRGLGEFWFINQLDPRTPVTFPSHVDHLQALPSSKPGDGLLVGVGGGKDSLVSIELLRGKVDNLATFSVDHEKQLTPLVQKIGLPHFFIERTWDRKLQELNKQGGLSGHVPYSAILGCAAVVTAVLAGRRDVVVSNEQSANEPDFSYDGVEINHQYSKSQEFEDDFQKVLQHLFGDQLRYYSFLRPLSELHIAEVFARRYFDTYQGVFSSCNRAYVHTSDRMFWCGECPKCAFAFLILTPFTERAKLESLWEGKNLLLDPGCERTYRQLLGIEGGKPLDCVGEIKESRSAMLLAQQTYPELAEKYQFDLPDDYDYKHLASHHMPADTYDILLAGLQDS